MRLRAYAVWVSLVLAIGAWPASAQQQRTPATGNFAFGGDVGFFVPRAGFDVGTTVDGFGEFYVSSRISVRGLVGWANPGIDNGGGCTFVPTVCGSNTWQHIRLEGSLLYNWEGEAWHPYLVGGFGAHFLRDTLTDEYSPHFSVHGGAGIEYFARHNLSVKGEVVFHALRHHGFDAQAANGYASPNPSGLTVTIGLKRYF